jgi:transcriptional regulator with XRE-family HTH domain
MSASTTPGPLGEFLALRRSRLTPAEIGLRTHGRRRVPGLRREELANRAGISAVYYARLEQGTSRNASPEVLNALSRALRLSDEEHRHLTDLAAGAHRPESAATVQERLAPALAQLLPALGDTPAVVLGRTLDVLAWNAPGHALTAGHLDADSVRTAETRPNTARNVFLDPRTIALYPDWDRKSRAVVGHLRMIAGRSPEVPGLAQLVAELTSRSAEFARLWADHTVGTCSGASYVIDHPVAGRLLVDQQTLVTPGSAEQSLVTYTPADGSGFDGLR